MIRRIAVIHFYYFIALAVLAVVYDAWKLITPEALLQRWQVALVLLVSSIVIWFITRQTKSYKPLFYKSLLGVLVLIDIFVAAASVYQQRGVASISVALFIVPLLVSASLRNASAIIATAAVAAAAYSFAVIKYAVDFPGEGFRIEMYGEILFWSAMLFIIASFLTLLFVKNKNA